MTTWFLMLWGSVLTLAIFSRSLVATLALIFLCVLGFQQALDLPDPDQVRWGVAGLFALCTAYAGTLVAKAERF